MSLSSSTSSSTESTDSPADPAADSGANPAANSDSLSTSNYVSIACEDRWQVYYRLQELGIEYRCSEFQPLEVSVKTPTEALQLWSIIQRVSYSRVALIALFDQCWRASYSRP